MIPAEIVQIALVILFGALWLIEKAKSRTLRHQLEEEKERARTIELENATLSGALAERPQGLNPPLRDGRDRHE
jgi:hypothetical protein